MEKPVLVIMAAGMGSRYGGLKQIDPVDEDGHIIMDYSLYDARRAGFERAVFIIKKENEEAFKEVIGNRIPDYMDVSYAFQDLANLPDGFQVPEGRVKPWGTAHAVLSAINEIQGPFAVVNADDYYGPEAFSLIYNYLANHRDDEKYRYGMVAYELKSTVTDHGTVARGVCQVNEQGKLVSVTERTKIGKQGQGIAYSEDDGATWTSISGDTLVSMNLWGFSKSILKEMQDRFGAFLADALKQNPLKCEYCLPTVVSDLLQEEKATVQILRTKGKWYGVTYKEDKPVVVEALRSMKEKGIYPRHLWREE